MDQKDLQQVIAQAKKDKATVLDLSGEGLTELPPEIGQLKHLELLVLRLNPLPTLPPEIGQLTNLERLYLSGNPLSALPPEIGQLTNLVELVIRLNRLVVLPPEIGQLSKLTRLDLSFNQLKALPIQVCQLVNLTELNLSGNQLTTLPPQIGQLKHLVELDLSFNPVTTLPNTIGELTALTELDLSGNQIAELTPALGQLSSLSHLDLSGNPFTILPPELGRLNNLKRLKLGERWETSRRLTSPPPEIIEQGTQAILGYLQEGMQDSRQQWVSKLLVVGEGGVGKTSLLRSLCDEEFNPLQATTHGISVRSIDINHPTKKDVTMQLNSWDFGGQEIYHATHQFFLTNRSLFVLVWNARHGYQQGKLYYWLDTIQALAPDSPVLIVATHIDERRADLPLTELRQKYPQIINHCEISNLDGTGINQLRVHIANAGANLPLMGEYWPTHWLNVATEIRKRPEKYITPLQLRQLTNRHGVIKKNAMVLAQWLHELGDILFFQYDGDLNDVVILKPQWVTEYISKVLESEQVIEGQGVFTRIHMNELWADLPETMRDHFLNLMEKFDLSYKTFENKEISLVVERLPLDPPHYQSQWDTISRLPGCRQVSMKFLLNTIPAGIPTWFIARSHRFTTHTHWRNGALFAYGIHAKHFALIQSHPHDRYLQLTVRGPNPHNFFAILKDGLELTLRRFPGLQIERKVICSGHNKQFCEHEFDYEQLIKRIDKKPVIECPESPNLEEVSVPNLLFGFDSKTQKTVLARLEELKTTPIENKQIFLDELRNLQELTQRAFTNSFWFEQAKPETHCPNVFALRPRQNNVWQQKIAEQEIDLQLYCQAPGQWHPTGVRGLYHLDELSRWITVMIPYLQHFISIFQHISPTIHSVLGKPLPNYQKSIKEDIILMTDLINVLANLRDESGLKIMAMINRFPEEIAWERAKQVTFRTLRRLLDEQDPQQYWGGLKKVYTPEGHHLWLCNKHAATYIQ